ncbi:MAG: HAD family hydrolase [Desulfobacterales bacterium]|jgi:HAD superfamily hydrolase (TIGR01484 family)
MSICNEIPRKNWHKGKSPNGLFVCDFDGTLLKTDRSFSSEDLEALKRLGELGIARAIATGRSLYSINTIPISNLPVDFLIFSSGAGINLHPDGLIIRNTGLEAHQVSQAIQILQASQLDFMVHRPIPDNHAFSYFESTSDNADFSKRIDIYRQFAKPMDKRHDGFDMATQLLAVVPPEDTRPLIQTLRTALPDFNIIQTTSPLDGRSTWIEIFPASVSKSLAAAWLAEKFGLNADRALSVGNDYNDLDLLDWAGCSFVVRNAPPDLTDRFPTVSSNDNGGVAQAVHQWLASGPFDHT